MLTSKENKDWYINVYTNRYKEYGYNPKTLGWLKGKQDIRFDILTSQSDMRGKSILDIGCGFGDLNICLREKFGNYMYHGIDLVPILIEEARKRYPSLPESDITTEFECEDFLSSELTGTYDYALASGIFNYNLKDQDNYSYVEAVMEKAFNCSKEGIAFDFLSDKVDYRHSHNFYYDPCQILSLAYHYTRNVVLRNDYMPFEFAVFLFKDDSFDKSDTTFNRYMRR